MREARRSLVYFQQHVEKDWIRIGYTGASGRRESAQPDFVPVALIQACEDDETALHAFFAGDQVSRIGEKSTYAGDAIYDYVKWLLDRNYAGRDRTEAERMPRLPWSVWNPATQRNEGHRGTLELFSALPNRERIAYARSDLAHLSSESDDWYTPDYIIEAARTAMGSIDLDPASCLVAQRKVKAATWYSKDQDGLRTDLPWKGAVWLNPPYGVGEYSAKAFVGRLLFEFEEGNVSQAITCLNVGAITANWFRPIWQTASCHLVVFGRVNFWNPDKVDSTPSKGTILSYFGDSCRGFRDAYAGIGVYVEAVS